MMSMPARTCTLCLARAAPCHPKSLPATTDAGPPRLRGWALVHALTFKLLASLARPATAARAASCLHAPSTASAGLAAGGPAPFPAPLCGSVVLRTVAGLATWVGMAQARSSAQHMFLDRPYDSQHTCAACGWWRAPLSGCDAHRGPASTACAACKGACLEPAPVAVKPCPTDRHTFLLRCMRALAY
jgi:hypothetical protein